ncbi:hypothetical protein BC939DRAFT_479906 [Gamsiella multidivaricata]|uniref:uncharacterized protein n=1 Tax=Gamsiella multidivaricata TaxID=101098 RepID=UPI0022205C7D|nr:uncharacterized protein BC939DRAFT_479906 [Gamsiella multidivaricata]KAG0364947.1 hypothetical protein BGZ54_007016 [Gamsiella multidivaricata]KAI7819097.1 hypothetical protein BC939DRAFT_479906 [Gamsiella multidivaricata]
MHLKTSCSVVLIASFMALSTQAAPLSTDPTQVTMTVVPTMPGQSTQAMAQVSNPTAPSDVKTSDPMASAVTPVDAGENSKWGFGGWGGLGGWGCDWWSLPWWYNRGWWC